MVSTMDIEGLGEEPWWASHRPCRRERDVYVNWFDERRRLTTPPREVSFTLPNAPQIVGDSKMSVRQYLETWEVRRVTRSLTFTSKLHVRYEGEK